MGDKSIKGKSPILKELKALLKGTIEKISHGEHGANDG